MAGSARKKRLLKSGGTGAAVAAVLALLVFLNLLSDRYYLRWDLTDSKQNSLSAETIKVLENIQEPVQIKAFLVDGRDETRKVEDLLAAYRYHNRQVDYSVIDPTRNPSEARLYDVTSEKTLILEGYGRSQTVKIPDEQKITNALHRLMESAPRRVYWLSGHGERSFEGKEPEHLKSFADALEAENCENSALNLMRGEPPRDADAIIVAAPEKPLFPEEIGWLDAFLEDGGRILVLLEPFRDGGLESFLRRHGIGISDDIVVDPFSRVMGGDYLMPMVSDYGDHEITKGFDLTSIFPMSRSLDVLDAEEASSGEAVCLAYTSEDSWAETDRAALDEARVELNTTDRKGPLCLAALVETAGPGRNPGEGLSGEAAEEGQADLENGRLAVFGDCDFASNQFLSVAGNQRFIVNTFRYLAGKSDFITVEPRRGRLESLTLSRSQGRIFFLFPVVVLPALVLLAGVWIWMRRRPK
ncbi:putative ABC-type uncharacterized transport system involved in gliding motility auxiliary component-like [uncultured Desulfatiglans sp.]|uniref:Putative ABC-type uncharacterized transport system involved in gliding motility auxiliary component-like n=1 Tax=Uncultured Desulfatiglans sp. TaxID=1748965 RepID=A0A653A410_UNCDX|nr:putative ABC-type uncharacterized transport system involved in gliding motility auxiliary component-like [uncultured Desulfatiglans sp.]